MLDFSSLVNIIFYKKKEFQYIDDKEKERLFFIFNRYMAKRYPENCDNLNKKGMDGALAINLWNKVCEKQLAVPNWFWNNSKKSKGDKIQGEELDEMDNLILEKFFFDDVKKANDEKEAESKIKSVEVKKIKGKKKK